jgi:protein pelota
VDDVAQRKVYVSLTESVQAKGGSVYIFSTLHPSGEQLKGLTGVAAILRFPLDLTHVDQNLDESSSDSSSSSGGSTSESDSSSSDEEEQQMFNVLKGK